MMNQYQKGIGMVEIMVSLLLLAVAILGFSALQMRSVGATDESLVRTRATSVVNSLAESMRNNTNYLSSMQKVFSSDAGITDCLDIKVKCNPEQMAQSAALEVKKQAEAEEFKVNVVGCPGVPNIANPNPKLTPKQVPQIYCAIVAWGDTKPNFGGESNDCAHDNGVYKRGSTCIIMETY